MKSGQPENFEISRTKLFLQTLAERIRKHSHDEVIRNRDTAERFSSFRYVDLNENMSSRILADLLNPRGEHGQGRLFLDGFLELCAVGATFFPAGFPVGIRCEAVTYSIADSLRRIDILLTSQGRAVAVENKIWAGDQSEQVLDYLRHLQKVAQNSFRLVYLAPAGRRISEDSLPASVRSEFANSFCTVSWQDLLQYLSQRAQEVRAEKLRFFLHDFIDAMHTAIGSPAEEPICRTQQIGR